MSSNNQLVSDLQNLFAQSELFSSCTIEEIEAMVGRGGFVTLNDQGRAIAALGSRTYKGPWVGYKDLGVEIEFPAVLLHSLIVSRDYRRQGYAAHLILQQLVKQAARVVDGNKVLDKVYTYAANEASHSLFEKIGFKDIVKDVNNGMLMCIELADWR